MFIAWLVIIVGTIGRGNGEDDDSMSGIESFFGFGSKKLSPCVLPPNISFWLLVNDGATISLVLYFVFLAGGASGGRLLVVVAGMMAFFVSFMMLLFSFSLVVVRQLAVVLLLLLLLLLLVGLLLL